MNMQKKYMQSALLSIFIYIVCVLALGVIIPKNALAAGTCRFLPGGSTVVDNLVFNFGVIRIPPTGEAGRVFYSEAREVDQIGGTVHLIRCASDVPGSYGPGMTQSFQLNQIMSGSSLGNKIYATNLPGIGIRMSWRGPGSYNGPTSYLVAPSSSTLTIDNTGPGDAAYAGGGGQKVQIELISMGGAVPAGVLNYNVQSAFQAVSSNVLPFANIMVQGTVVTPGCSVESNNINIALGDYLTTQFGSIGSVTQYKPLNVVLNCNNGTKLNAKINADAENSALGTIRLTQVSGSATGVGVQILDTVSNPVHLNEKFLVDTITSNGQYNINWKARYIKTSETITPGIANATATLTLTYE